MWHTSCCDYWVCTCADIIVIPFPQLAPYAASYFPESFETVGEYVSHWILVVLIIVNRQSVDSATVSYIYLSIKFHRCKLLLGVIYSNMWSYIIITILYWSKLPRSGFDCWVNISWISWFKGKIHVNYHVLFHVMHNTSIKFFDRMDSQFVTIVPTLTVLVKVCVCAKLGLP